MRPSNAVQFACGTLLCIASIFFERVEIAIYGAALIVFAGLVRDKS